MIETIIALVVALIGGAFFYGRRTRDTSDLKAMRKAKENHEEVQRIDDLASEFDRLREKRR